MSKAAASHLELHRDFVGISVGASRASGSFDRGPTFTELRNSFPGCTALDRFLYGQVPIWRARAVFQEDGVGLSEVFGGVGTRQGCSWTFFLYCLAIHPLLAQLDKEFGGKIKVLAFADDVHFLGLLNPAVAVIVRWDFLLGPLL